MKFRRKITAIMAAVAVPMIIVTTAPGAAADADKHKQKGSQHLYLHVRSDRLNVKLEDPGHGGTYAEIGSAIFPFKNPRIDLVFYNLNGRQSRVIRGTQHYGNIRYKSEDWVIDSAPAAYFLANPGTICARLMSDGKEYMRVCADLKP